MTLGSHLACPSFWPCVLLLYPCLRRHQTLRQEEIRNTVWILTDQEVIVARAEEILRHIRLRNIVKCYVQQTCGDPLPLCASLSWTPYEMRTFRRCVRLNGWG
jgi:hypothetical protein